MSHNDDLVEEIVELFEQINNNNYEDDDCYVKEVRVNDEPTEKLSVNKIQSAKMWASQGNFFTPCEKAVPKLEAGQYTIGHSDSMGVYFRTITTNIDNLIEFPDSASNFIIQNLEEFWGKESIFREFGFLWKRGVLMFGPPGSGKTSTLQLIIKRIIERDGIAVFVERPQLASEGLRILRQIEPSRPVVVILEDIDAIAQNYGESAILALLDGELQIDNVVFIATTNYPERLDKRLINRPSRFDIVKKVGMPNAEARKLYLTKKNPRFVNLTEETSAELETWIEDTKEFSVAHLKELIILIEVFATEYSVAIKRLQQMCKANHSSDNFGPKQTFGFSNDDGYNEND